MRIRETIEVRRPIEEAFAYVADFSNSAEWDPGVAQARKLGAGPVGEGTVFELVALFRGSRVPLRYVVTEYEENRRVVLEGEGEKARATDVITFAPTDPGSAISRPDPNADPHAAPTPASEAEGEEGRATDEVTFERATAGTRITYEADLRMRGVYRLAEPFLRGTFRGIGRDALAGLKATLDSGG